MLAALPAIAFAIFIVVQGGLVFALGILALGIICLGELFTMLAAVRPVRLAGFLGITALVLACGRSAGGRPRTSSWGERRFGEERG